MSFVCSRQSSGSRSLPVTLSLSWTVICQCRNMYLCFADLVSTTYDNSDQWPDRWHQQLPRQWSRHLYRVALITVTRYYTAAARTWCDASSQFKMPPHVFLLEPDAEITSRRCYVARTGFRSGGGSTSSWRLVHLSLDKLFITSPMIFTSLLQVQVTSSVPLRTTDRSCSVPRTYSTSGDRSFAAAGTRVWDHLPSNLRDEKLSFRSFRRLLKTLVYCWPQRNVNNYLLRYRNTLTYLLTYLLTHMSRSRLRHVKEHSAYRQAYM